MLRRPCLHDEAAAFARLESVLRPNGPVSPHCGCTGRLTKIAPNPEKRVRVGPRRCGDCKRQVTVGTGFEASKVPLRKWPQAVWLMTASKKGVSSRQLHRGLDAACKTAWFMSHRIREAMRSGDQAPFGGNGAAVEVDEAVIGREPGAKGREAAHSRGGQHRMKVLSRVDREAGQARSFALDRSSTSTILPVAGENMAKAPDDRRGRMVPPHRPRVRRP